LLIPQGALPANVAPSSIRIITLKPENSPLIFDGKPPLSAYQLEPDGLHFTTPAVIRVTVDQPADGGVPMLFTVSGQTIEVLTNNTAEVDPKNPKRIILTAPITHFSSLLSYDPFFSVYSFDYKYGAPNTHAIGDPFIVHFEINGSKASGTIALTPLVKPPIPKVELRYSLANWSLAGHLEVAEPAHLTPDYVVSYPPFTSMQQPGWKGSDETFTCLPPPFTSTYIDFRFELSYVINVSIVPAGTVGLSQPPWTGVWDHAALKSESCVPLVSQLSAIFVSPEKSTHYGVLAADPDGDELTYKWSNSNPCGTFVGTSGPTATWIHPDSDLPGACPNQAVHPGTITVVVSDGHGATQTVKYNGGSGNGTLFEKDIPYAP